MWEGDSMSACVPFLNKARIRYFPSREGESEARFNSVTHTNCLRLLKAPCIYFSSAFARMFRQLS